MIARSIDEVLQYLDRIIAENKVKPSHLGFFAALYRVVTQQVKTGIAEGFFEDGPRMERLDVVFANRYLAAYTAMSAGQPTTKSWAVAFQEAKNGRLLILQHLLLGINAHINLDLGIAAAEVAPGASLPALKTDFNRINDILGTLIQPAEAAIGKFSPLIRFLDKVGGKTEEQLIGFSMGIARQEAWFNAELLANVDAASRIAVIRLIDQKVALLGKKVAAPPGFLGTAIKGIRFFERDNIPAIIDSLAALQPEKAVSPRGKSVG